MLDILTHTQKKLKNIDLIISLLVRLQLLPNRRRKKTLLQMYRIFFPSAPLSHRHLEEKLKKKIIESYRKNYESK